MHAFTYCFTPQISDLQDRIQAVVDMHPLHGGISASMKNCIPLLPGTSHASRARLFVQLVAREGKLDVGMRHVGLSYQTCLLAPRTRGLNRACCPPSLRRGGFCESARDVAWLVLALCEADRGSGAPSPRPRTGPAAAWFGVCSRVMDSSRSSAGECRVAYMRRSCCPAPC